jgi:ribosome maturation factor RimP
VNQLGVGANVKPKLTAGEKLQGFIEQIDEEAFLFFASEQESSPRRVAYDQVAELRLANLTYKASTQPNPVEARRVATALGTGKHVVVKISGEKKLHGHIRAIETEHFTLLPDNQSEPIQIVYAEVWQVGKNLGTGATLAIIGGAVAAAVAVGVAASGGEEQVQIQPGQTQTETQR